MTAIANELTWINNCLRRYAYFKQSLSFEKLTAEEAGDFMRQMDLYNQCKELLEKRNAPVIKTPRI